MVYRRRRRRRRRPKRRSRYMRAIRGAGSARVYHSQTFKSAKGGAYSFHQNFVSKNYLPGIMGRKQHVVFKACEQTAFTSATSEKTLAREITPTNPLDPFGSLSGKKPTGWDQWTPFFNKWRTLSATVVLRFWRNTAATPRAEDLVVGYLPSATAGAIVDTDAFSAWCEWPRSQYRFMPAQSATGGGTSFKKMTYVMRPKTFFWDNMGSGDFDVLTSGTLATNTPTLALLFAESGSNNLTDSTLFGECHISVVIRGYFFDRKELAVS